MKSEELTAKLKAFLGEDLETLRVTAQAEGVSRKPSRAIWAKLPKKRLHETVAWLWGLGRSHLTVISGSDTGETVELTYHLTHGWATMERETTVHLQVELDKADLTMETLTDIIPGAVITEREKKEMLGVRFIGLTDERHLFLPSNFPGGVYPWRKDEQGVPPEMVRDLRDEGVSR